MAERQMPATSGPERERRSARWLATPFIFMAVIVVLVIAVALLTVRPWEADGAFERTTPPAPTAAP
jgi:hypothetical protein